MPPVFRNTAERETRRRQGTPPYAGRPHNTTQLPNLRRTDSLLGYAERE